jgi:hypothetical protein
VAVVHDAMPENAFPLNAIVRGWLYQLFESGGRVGAPVAVGAETSTWIVYCWLSVTVGEPLQVAEQDVVVTASWS